jgi:ABC-type Na+ efflux pump permease subunit
MDRMRELLSFVIAAMAMVSLICSIYEAMNQRATSSLSLATIFFLSTLLFYLPRLETLSALGIEVRLRNTLYHFQIRMTLRCRGTR